MNQFDAQLHHHGDRAGPSSTGDTTRFAFVHAQWHAEIVHCARDAFIAEMARHRIPRDSIDVIEVPGAFELPLHAQCLAARGRHAPV